MPNSTEPSSIRARALLLALFWFSACTRPLGCGKDTKVDFDAPASEARPITIAVKSYRGSRQALVDAAVVMMNQNPRFLAGSDPESMNQTGSETVVLSATQDDRACVATAVTYTTTTSVAELTQMMRAIEERLSPIPDVDPTRPTIKLELWWAGGEHGTGYGWQLPNPIILQELWANHLFVTGSEPLFAGFVEGHPSEVPWAKRVARMSESNLDTPIPRRIGWAEERPSQEQAGRDLLYRHGGVDQADVLAHGTSLALFVDAHRHRYIHEPEFRGEPSDLQFGLAQTPFEKRPRSWVEPVEVHVPGDAAIIERYRLWVNAVRKAIEVRSLGVGTVVIFDDQPEFIRGAVIGAAIPREQLVPAAGAELHAVIAFTQDPVLPPAYEIRMQLPAPAALQADGPKPPIRPTP